MAINELFSKLEDAVSVAKEKEQAKDTAQAELLKAQSEYTAAVAEVEKLRAEVNEIIGGMFSGNNPKIRIAS